MTFNSNRTRVVIDPTVQWALARRLTYHWVTFFALLIGISASLRVLFDLVDYSFVEACNRAFMEQVPQITIMVLVLPMFLYDSLKMSNRFAGPMYRVRKSLERMAEGIAQPVIKFRDGDFWLEVATQLNAVRERLETLEVRNAQLQLENRQLREAMEGQDAEDLCSTIRR